jgi:hypothetical protein
MWRWKPKSKRLHKWERLNSGRWLLCEDESAPGREGDDGEESDCDEEMDGDGEEAYGEDETYCEDEEADSDEEEADIDEEEDGKTLIEKMEKLIEERDKIIQERGKPDRADEELKDTKGLGVGGGYGLKRGWDEGFDSLEDAKRQRMGM